MNEHMEREEGARGSGVVVIGFGMTVAIWAIGYVGHLPPGLLPSWSLLICFIAALFAGGWIAGRLTGQGWIAGMGAAFIASLLNLLILGSLISAPSDSSAMPSMAIWLPGSLLIGAILGAIGGLIAGKSDHRSRPIYWPTHFPRITAAATFFLLIVGGLVTSSESGLAVPDWPNSYGYNMFLYPLKQMTGGIFYEHAHRLFGALVGLTTVAMGIFLLRHESRKWVKRLAVAAMILVVFQGFLGGLRVTGRLTMSADAEHLAPNAALAVIHGVVAQIFFIILITLAVVTSRSWRRPQAGQATWAEEDRNYAIALAALILVQITLGAILRHLATGLFYHIGLAVIVILSALLIGIRAWGGATKATIVQRLGLTLTVMTLIQLGLGLAALIVTGALKGELTPPSLYGQSAPPVHEVLTTTAHQAAGAVLLALAVALALWLHAFSSADRSPSNS